MDRESKANETTRTFLCGRTLLANKYLGGTLSWGEETFFLDFGNQLLHVLSELWEKWVKEIHQYVLGRL